MTTDIFLQQSPHIIPPKIKSQYEQEADRIEQLEKSAKTERVEGRFNNYLQVSSRKRSPLTKLRPIDYQNQEPTDLNLFPSNSVKYFEEPKNSLANGPSPYDEVVNKQIVKQSGSPPKFTFQSREYYEQADILCKQFPDLPTDRRNPIYQFVSNAESPYRSKDRNESSDS